ncbi:Carboxypeptidase G2 precursor [Rubripirellula lacrimiformis]|uniref:Carboxypeptidase G2 n=2 Tax=Rubripirellula lacrimiformis TaxID=1930273 RepID=A0A517NKK3_9BACT|nr:Carboxypeptidase G2 precursor [Rubripirellula lacrimiformis]
MDASISGRLDQAAQWIAGQHSSAVDQLIGWCDTNSWSLDEVRLKAMADRLASDFKADGIPLDSLELPDVRLLGNAEQWVPQPTGPLLVWHHNADAPKRVLLMIHYDTVYPHGSQPSQCRQSGDRLIGPGTADAKGGISVIKLAAGAIIRFGLAQHCGVSVVLNPDEEIGTTGSGDAIEQMAAGFDRALVFEPTLPDGSMVANRKGSGNFALSVHGRSAHAGRNPEDGRNAIVHLSKMVGEVAGLHQPDAGLSVNVGHIEGGGPLNRVPDHASVQLNIRVVDDVAMDRAETSLKSIVDRYTVDGYHARMLGQFHSPPKLVDDAGRVMQKWVQRAGRYAGRDFKWLDTGGACDGSKLAAWGLPNVDTMGVSGGGLHSPDEFCEVTSLVPAAVTVAAAVAEFSSQASK